MVAKVIELIKEMEEKTSSVVELIFVIIMVLGIAFGLLSLVVWIGMLLWNGVLHNIFPVVPEVSFWQMWGLWILSDILFKPSSSGKND